MKLGLDLRGGVHFLLEVDMDKAISQRMKPLPLICVVSSVKTKLNLTILR